MLTTLAKYVPLGAYPAPNLDGRTPPRLFFRIEDRRLQVVQSRAGVAQGCNLCYGTAGVEPLREIRRSPPVKGATICGYIVDRAIAPLPGISMVIASVAAVTRWLQECILRDALVFNHRRSKVVLPGGLGSESLSQYQQRALDATGLTVGRERMYLYVYQSAPETTKGAPPATSCEVNPQH